MDIELEYRAVTYMARSLKTRIYKVWKEIIAQVLVTIRNIQY